MREGLVVTGVGMAIGLLGAMMLSRVLVSMVFGISALDPRVMAAAALFMATVAGLAAYLPAHRATVVEPSSVLQ